MASEKGIVELVEKAENPEEVHPDASTIQSMWQSARHNPKVLLYSALMTMGPMAYGFDIVIVGVVTAIPAFL